MANPRLSRKFDRQANIYERKRNQKAQAEWRSKLIQNAEGNVLELAVGAGANFAYYRKDIQLTAVDISPKMLEKAKESAMMHRIQTDFMLHDIEALSFPENTFDTIVSTLSFCGYDDPVKMFNNVNSWCRPGGKILLMEHGISSNSLFAFIQKLIDPIHLKIVGCHQKRDMIKLMEASNLQVLKHERHWQGMLHLWQAEPGKGV